VASGPATASQPAGLLLRLAAMVYEAVLLFGVVFIVSYALLAALRWTYPLPGAQRAALQGVLFVAVGAYFVWCWTRSGQTLALKTWRLKVVGPDSSPPSMPRATARYVLAWHLWIPGLAYIAVTGVDVVPNLVALAAGFALLLLPAATDPQRRLLHDRWTATRVVRV
jgi:uncharacterized RDD family membrane protein YckC